jgi:hypothetical protein
MSAMAYDDTSYVLPRLLTQAAALTALLIGSLGLAQAQSVTLPSSFDTLSLGSDVAYVSVSRTGVTPSISCPSCGNVRMTVAVSGNGSVRITTTTGLSAPTGYTSAAWTAGGSEIAFEGTVANVNAAFSTLQYNGARATLSASLSPAAYFYFATTGNYYFVDTVTTNRTWTQARTYAEGLTLWGGGVGPTGYMATVRSAAEFNFVRDKAGLATQIWLGASRYNAQTGSGNDTDWKWVGGPVAEKVTFFQGARFNDAGAGPVAGQYNAWCNLPPGAQGEPNNAGGTEGYLQSTPAGCWNDLSNTSGGAILTVVEFTGAGSASNATTSISGPESVPMLSPALLVLFASMLAGCGIYYQRRRKS